jgi:hypothetical protein
LFSLPEISRLLTNPTKAKKENKPENRNRKGKARRQGEELPKTDISHEHSTRLFLFQEEHLHSIDSYKTKNHHKTRRTFQYVRFQHPFRTEMISPLPSRFPISGKQEVLSLIQPERENRRKTIGKEYQQIINGYKQI